MDFGRWARRSIRRVRADGVAGLKDSTRPLYHKLLQQGNTFHPPGENIYEFDWDVLVILDACRLDLMCEVEDGYDFISEVSSKRSLGSATTEWMEKTFVPQYSEEMEKTEYLCGNPFSASKLSTGDFARLEEVWEYEWIDIGTVPPRPITDRTIAACRDHDPDRVIAHYMQPHCPFIPHPELMRSKQLNNWGDQETKDVWERLRAGELSEGQVWTGYKENLRYVLDEVEILLNNVDAEKVVISSDHGNAKGEWGVYGHPPGLPFQCVREVPWIETSATDSGKHEPVTERSSDVSVNRDDQLSALGYV